MPRCVIFVTDPHRDAFRVTMRAATTEIEDA